MKNKVISVLLILNLITVIVMLNFYIKGKIYKEKEILKEMSESTQITDLNNTINTLQASHLEYSTKVQTHKSNLATAITNAGVSTSGDATFETMIDNVSKIVSTKTSDATATAAQILSGKTAWVSGTKITGTMTNRGTWTSTPTSSGKVTIPAGYHNGSGYVDTSNISSGEQIIKYLDTYRQSSRSINLDLPIGEYYIYILGLKAEYHDYALSSTFSGLTVNETIYNNQSTDGVQGITIQQCFYVTVNEPTQTLNIYNGPVGHFGGVLIASKKELNI